MKLRPNLKERLPFGFRSSKVKEKESDKSSCSVQEEVRVEAQPAVDRLEEVQTEEGEDGDSSGRNAGS